MLLLLVAGVDQALGGEGHEDLEQDGVRGAGLEEAEQLEGLEGEGDGEVVDGVAETAKGLAEGEIADDVKGTT